MLFIWRTQAGYRFVFEYLDKYILLNFLLLEGRFQCLADLASDENFGMKKVDCRLVIVSIMSKSLLISMSKLGKLAYFA